MVCRVGGLCSWADSRDSPWADGPARRHSTRGGKCGMTEATTPALPPAPLLELMLRAREGRSSYRIGTADCRIEVDPAEEVNRWLRRRVEKDDGLVEYLRHGVPQQSWRYALNRVTDASRELLYSTLEPWRIGTRYAQFERYAARVVALMCWAFVSLDDDPCLPLYERPAPSDNRSSGGPTAEPRAQEPGSLA
jgi:hypothetical protein